METLGEYILLILTALPFVGALALILFPTNRPKAVAPLVLVITSITLVLSVYVFVAYDRVAGGYQFIERYEWLPQIGASLHLGIDGIAAAMMLLNGVVAFTGTLVSWKLVTRPKDFFILFLLLVSGVYGTFASLDLLFFFFFYELAVLPMYLLIGVWGSTTDFKTFFRPKEYGALKLTLMLVAGSVLVWIALLAMWQQGSDSIGRLTFNFFDLREVAFPPTFQKIFFPFLFVGFGVLAGLWPFHTWSPDGHVAAPTSVSMLHAGVLMKLGAFGILRVGMELLPEGARSWGPVMIGLGSVNVIYGAVSALAQKDLKYVVGYSSVSHMGYVIMGLGTLDQIGINGAVMQMFSHGIMTALFFCMVGVIYERAHLRDITVLEGLSKRMGFAAAFLTIAGLASLGLPGLSGFAAELVVFIGIFRTYPILGVLAVIGAALTAVYILRLLGKVFFGPVSERWAHLTDASKLDIAAASILVGMLVLWGLYPLYIYRIIDSGVLPIAKRLVGG
ncbi:MAG: NADH-quinone oxidoreductase subunit M [Dehalococcoidia bacterium]|nr:NADH-quinone oxidoreductase subunit M [Dehalococcoidia bacterium]